MQKISSWTGYFCVFLLLALGCDLLLSTNHLLTNENPDYGVKKSADIVIESTPIKRIFTLERSGGSRNLYAHIPSIDDRHLDGSFCTPVHNYISRSNIIEQDSGGDRKKAWKKLLSFADAEHASES